jgi:tetratricopeptide (TPR) repeat protein
MKKISLILFTAVVLAACNKKELDLYPYNQIETTQAFNNTNNVDLALGGVYNGLRAAGSYYQGDWNIAFEVVSDNLVLNQQGRLSQQTFYNWQYTGNGTTGIFGNAYTVIRRCNAIIENIDKVTATDAYKNNVKGQALAVRALLHFDLSRVYGVTFANATDKDSTAPYVISTDATLVPGKMSVKEVYNKVVADLTNAENLIGTANGVGKISKNAVQGFLSKVYLYMGDWDKSIASASAALGATPAVGTITSVPSIWTDASEVGVIFKIKNTLTDNSNTLGVNYYQIVGGGIKSEYNVDYNFFQLFKSNDVRKATYTVTSAYNGVTYNHVVKYAGKTGFPVGVLDGKVLRSAEVLLNRAEAYYRSGNTSAALADLNLLKSNRYSAYTNVTLSGSALLDEILLERRLELAFEGDRFFDLKRRNAGVTRSGKGDKADGTGTAPVFLTLAPGDYKLNFPFPQAELNFNKKLTQVAGY